MQYNDLDRYKGILPATPSGKQTSSALISTGICLFTGIKVVTNGTNDVTVKAYDGIDGTGTQIDEWIVAGDENYGGTQYGKTPLKVSTGLYITVSGTGGYFFASYFKPVYATTFDRAGA